MRDSVNDAIDVATYHLHDSDWWASIYISIYMHAYMYRYIGKVYIGRLLHARLG